jgi:hypothetical protein
MIEPRIQSKQRSADSTNSPYYRTVKEADGVQLSAPVFAPVTLWVTLQLGSALTICLGSCGKVVFGSAFQVAVNGILELYLAKQ